MCMLVMYCVCKHDFHSAHNVLHNWPTKNVVYNLVKILRIITNYYESEYFYFGITC